MHYPDAACAGTDVDLFFPARGEDASQAKAACGVCPRREECLEYAVTAPEMIGIWGGKSERERKRIRRARRGAAA